MLSPFLWKPISWRISFGKYNMFLRGTSIFILIIITCGACKDPQQSKLLGHWELDSIADSHGKIIKADSLESAFTLLNDKSFIFKWSHFDVFGEYIGTYLYKRNDNATQLIFFVHSPDKKDSIIQKRVMTILTLNDTFLITKELENHISFDSTISSYNRICIYRKR